MTPSITERGIPGRPVRSVHSGDAQSVDESYDLALRYDMTVQLAGLLALADDVRTSYGSGNFPGMAYECLLLAGNALALHETIRREHPPEPERR